jgi:hypothetical protein
MIKRNYYSVRTGKAVDGGKLPLEMIKKLFLISYRKLSNDGYFQKYFGTDCTDGDIPGELGQDIESIVFVNLRKESLFPVWKYIDSYTEEDLFDMIEFLYDHSSKGIEGSYHDWNQCGMHYNKFDDQEGRKHFRETINPVLAEYQDGFEISEDGEILILAESGLANLYEADIPSTDTSNINSKVEAAIRKFRRHRASLDERKEAIRELADVLEYLRPEIKIHLLKQDEGDLFNIANTLD